MGAFLKIFSSKYGVSTYVIPQQSPACRGKKQQHYLIKSLNHFHQNPLLSGRHGSLFLEPSLLLFRSMADCSCWDCFTCSTAPCWLYFSTTLKRCKSVPFHVRLPILPLFWNMLLLLYIFFQPIKLIIVKFISSYYIAKHLI